MMTTMIFTILECAKVNIIDLTKKNHGFISLALDRYLEDLNPFGSDRWSNSTIRLTQIRWWSNSHPAK
jgi:hypothetical protein